jgi:hypothetical protein
MHVTFWLDRDLEFTQVYPSRLEPGYKDVQGGESVGRGGKRAATGEKARPPKSLRSSTARGRGESHYPCLVVELALEASVADRTLYIRTPRFQG